MFYIIVNEVFFPAGCLHFALEIMFDVELVEWNGKQTDAKRSVKVDDCIAY